MPGGNLVHFIGYRIRVVGTGSLKSTFYGLDEILSDVNPAYPMTPTNSKEPFIHGNFVSQRSKLRIYTTEINEYFKVNNITFFVKTYASGDPQ
jgi:hypothetical protein